MNFKIKSKFYDFEEKENYIEHLIEDCIRYFGTMLPTEYLQRKKIIMSIKKEILKNELKFLQNKQKNLSPDDFIYMKDNKLH